MRQYVTATVKETEVCLSEEKGEERPGERTLLRKSGSDGNLFSEKGEHKRLNTQDETPNPPHLTTSVIVAKTNRDNPEQEQTIGCTFKR